jgi:hypothetical protein
MAESWNIKVIVTSFGKQQSNKTTLKHHEHVRLCVMNRVKSLYTNILYRSRSASYIIFSLLSLFLKNKRT